MCDSANSINGYLTAVDLDNARKYARMQILYNQAKKYKDKIVWIDKNSDGSSTYYCPPGLDCKDGYVRIATSDECYNNSNFNKELGPVNGYYLEWHSDKGVPNEGQCYLANPTFRKMCESGNFDKSDKGVDGLYYDLYSGRCFITDTYCHNTGQLSYVKPSPDAIPDYIINRHNAGGSCDLTGGQKALDFIFGDTIAKGLLGGKCFK
jgi:hypothetical protein